MSVEYCVVRVASQTFEQLQQPGLLQDLMDEFHTPQSSAYQERADARDSIRGTPVAVPAILRMLYFDEFTTSLLVDFLDESSAMFKALAGWGEAHILAGVRYGYGEIAYYLPDEVKTVSRELDAYPEALLEERLQQRVDTFRIAAAGYFEDDQAIRAHQRLFAGFLRRFYEEAARDGNFVLLLTV